MVLATASAVRFDSDAVLGARVTLKIERILKGSTSPTLEIPMGGGPEPAGTWEEVILGYEENAPLLLPGDRAVLFLEYDQRTKSYGVQSFSGEYLVDAAGKVQALEMNPFAAEVNGKTVDQFAAAIRTALVQ